jgi:putative oxidoreductase
MKIMRSLFDGRAAGSVVLIRLMVGSVFFFEGVLKFLYPDQLASGRFARIGIPAPHVLGPFVGGVETICGAFVIIGLLTRLATIPLLINISVAILTTKIPILLGHGYWGFALAKLPHYGFLSMMHEARIDFSMWLGLVFLLVVGPGRWSIDFLVAGKARSKPA